MSSPFAFTPVFQQSTVQHHDRKFEVPPQQPTMFKPIDGNTSKFPVITRVTDCLSICQDPVGNIVMVASKIEPNITDTQSVSSRMASSMVSSVIPYVKGVAVIKDNQLTIALHTSRGNSMYTIPTVHSDTVMPVVFDKEIEADLETTIDAIEEANIRIIKDSYDKIRDSFDKLHEISPIRLRGDIERIVSISTIYHELGVRSYQSKTVEVKKELKLIHEINNNFIKLSELLSDSMDTINMIHNQLDIIDEI